MLSEASRFQKANQVAQEQADVIKCLAIFQTGSSLRKEDFSPWSDVDLLVVYREEPNQHWKHEYTHGIDLSLLQESEQAFLRNLERGVPFELTAIRHGRVLKGKEWVRKLRKHTYKPTRLTFTYKIQSALNHFVDLLRVPTTLGECYHSAYHSYRELARYVMLHTLGRFVEGDALIRHELEAIIPQLARTFWDLRGKRLDPSRSKNILDMDGLEDALHQELKEIASLGKMVFHIEGLHFPSLARLKGLLKKRGYTLASVSFAKFLERKHYTTITGRRKGSKKRKIFFFDMDTGDLREGSLEL